MKNVTLIFLFFVVVIYLFGCADIESSQDDIRLNHKNDIADATSTRTSEEGTPEPSVNKSSSTDIMSAKEERGSQQTTTDVYVDWSDSSPCTHPEVPGEEKTEPSTDENDPIETTTNTDATTKDTESTNVNTEQIKPTSPYDVVAKEGTEELLAERIIYYINLYREEEGNITTEVLPGLTEYAKYRSRQLVTNYAHDKQDIRDAAAALQYGRYVDPSSWGEDRAAYYDPMAQEAINYYSPLSPKTVDEIAKKIVDSFRNSRGHWVYLGAIIEPYNTHQYIGVGVTFKNGSWYICVYTTDTAEYG